MLHAWPGLYFRGLQLYQDLSYGRARSLEFHNLCAQFARFVIDSGLVGQGDVDDVCHGWAEVGG